MSQSSGIWKSKTKVQQGSDSGKGSLPGLRTATFSLQLLMVFPLSVSKERERVRASSLLSLLLRTLILLDQGPTLTTSLNLNYFLIGHLSL